MQTIYHRTPYLRLKCRRSGNEANATLIQSLMTAKGKVPRLSTPGEPMNAVLGNNPV